MALSTFPCPVPQRLPTATDAVIPVSDRIADAERQLRWPLGDNYDGR